MFAIYASYRGRSRRRAAYVRSVAEALAAGGRVDRAEVVGVSDLRCVAGDPELAGGVILSLVQAGDFALGVGAVVGSEAEDADPSLAAAAAVIHPRQRAGSVRVRIEWGDSPGIPAPGRAAEVAQDVEAAFVLLGYVLARRTEEGRAATALLRAGYSQSEAARELGITKQAMSQRLAAAGWQAEQSGWSLAVRMLARIDELGGGFA